MQLDNDHTIDKVSIVRVAEPFNSDKRFQTCLGPDKKSKIWIHFVLNDHTFTTVENNFSRNINSFLNGEKILWR